MKKMAKDILYSKLKGLSDKELLESGWFNTKLSLKETEEHYLLNMFGHDLSQFNNNLNEIILLSTGSFAPLHEGNIFSWISAIKEAEKQNLETKLFLISPSHDDYVFSKSNVHKKYNIYERINLIKNKLEDFLIIIQNF